MIEQRGGTLPASCTPTGPPSELLLSSEPQSARAAREFVRKFVEYHVPGVSQDHVDAAVLVTCELVTNALRYGTEPGDMLRVVLDANAGRTRVEVHDPVRRRPSIRPESDDRNRGRGLLIVDTLCPNGWGITDRPMGKAVWAEVEGA